MYVLYFVGYVKFYSNTLLVGVKELAEQVGHPDVALRFIILSTTRMYVCMHREGLVIRTQSMPAHVNSTDNNVYQLV